MRSDPSDYNLISPTTISEALSKLAAEPGVWRPFAGGTDIMVLYEAGQLTSRHWLNLSKIQELGLIEDHPTFLDIAAMVTYRQIQNHPIIRTEFPNLVYAGRETGGPAIQNRGTVGGNIANASPAADTPPALLAYGAELELVSSLGSRWLKLADFYQAYKQTALRSDELIRRVRLYRNQGWTHHWYRKVGTRGAQAISKVVLAGALELENGAIRRVQLACGSVAPTVVRLSSVEKVLIGQILSPAVIDAACTLVHQDIKPIDDIRSTAEYRLQVCINLLKQLLSELSGK